MISAQYKKRASYFARIFFFVLLSVFFMTVPAVRAATPEFTPLVGLPGLDNLGKDTTIPQYINQIYLLTIAIGALLGVMRLAWAGVKYSLSDVVTEKSEAKHDMTGVLMGLAILLIPFVVLKEINPDLVRLDVLRVAPNIGNLPGGDATNGDTTNNAPSINPTVDSIEGKDQPAYMDCMARGKKWDSSNDVCTDEQVRDPKVACEAYGRVWEGRCAPLSQKAISVPYLKGAGTDVGVLTENWTNLCKNRGNYKLNVVDDGGNNIVFQCIPQ